MAIFLVFIVGWLGYNLLSYVFWIPHPAVNPRPTSLIEHYFGTALYGIAYVLSLLRLPFAALPYLTKLVLFLLMRTHYHVGRYDSVVEGVRIIGDVLNFVVTSALMMRLGVPLWCVSLTVSAEFIRLLAEKGQMIISAVWQQLPHRLVAHFMATHAPSWRWLHRYCAYYILDDAGRLEYVLHTLKQNAQNDSEFAHKLAYVNEFQVVSHDIGLRAGAVRDVAGGAIFIHRA